MESRRIIRNKKTIILICILLLFNGCWYLYQQHSKWKGYELSIAEASQMQQNYISATSNLNTKQKSTFLTHKQEELSKQIDESFSQENFSMKKVNPLYGETKILEDLQTQYNHVNTYHEKLEKIKNRAQLMSSISIFQVTDSFSKKNITKTVDDYRYVSDITLKAGINQPITDTVFDPILRYLSIIFILFIVLAFIEERKIGLWQKIHSTANGRAPLAVKRIFLLLGSSILFQFLIITERLILSSMIYGNPNVFRSIQSIPEFMKFIYPINILGYLFLYCLICGICSFCFGLLAWLLFSILHSPIMGIFLLSIGTASEWIFYFFIPLQSNFSILKYANFYYFINPTKEFAEYCNINLFGLVANRMIILLVSSIIISIGFSCLIVVLSNRIKPIRIPGILDRLWKRFTTFCGSWWRKLLSKRSGFFLELYKIFGTYKGYLIILVLVIYLLSSYESYQLLYSKDEIVQNKFYAENSGPIKNDNYENYIQLKNKAKSIQKIFKKAEDEFGAGTITTDELNQIQNKYKNDSMVITLVENLNHDVERLNKLKNKNNITPWFNNTMGMEMMFDKNTERNRLNRIQLSILITILLISFSYSQEKKSEVKDKLRTTVNGRSGLFRKKILSNVLICFLISGLIWIFDYTYYSKLFPMGKIFAPIQTIEALDFIPFHCNVLSFLLILFCIRWLLLCCVSFFVSYLSTRFTTIVTIIISMILFIVPSLLAIIGIRLFKTFAIVDAMTLINPIIQKNYTLDFKFKIIALILLGAAGVALCYRQWCKKGVGYETRH